MTTEKDKNQECKPKKQQTPDDDELVNKLVVFLFERRLLITRIVCMYGTIERKKAFEAVEAAILIFLEESRHGFVKVLWGLTPEKLDDRVIQNKCIKYIRVTAQRFANLTFAERKKFQKFWTHVDRLGNTFSAGSDPLLCAECQQIFLAECKKRLDPEDYRILEMNLDSIPDTAIARELRIHRHTVRNRLQRIRRAHDLGLIMDQVVDEHVDSHWNIQSHT